MLAKYGVKVAAGDLGCYCKTAEKPAANNHVSKISYIGISTHIIQLLIYYIPRMNIANFKLKLNGELAGDLLGSFASPMGGTVSADKASIDTRQVHGLVTWAPLEEGLHLYVFQLNILRDQEFASHCTIEEQDVYLLTYLFQPEFETARVISEGGPRTVEAKYPSLLIMPDRSETRFTYLAGSRALGISLLCSADWLNRQLAAPGEQGQSVPQLLRLIESTMYRPLSKGELIISKTLFKDLNASANTLEIKAHVYSLLSFLYRSASIKAYRNTQDRYRPTLLKIEKRITSSLYTSMPSAEDLSKEYFMSASTLKRQFKQMYGTTLYDYYLLRKMELAKKLLEEGGQSVSAVAFQLGYESLSHFTAIFKKIHGHSPGKSKRPGKD